jgi:hypothetical protein
MYPIAFDEADDKCISKATGQREEKDNGLKYEHLVGPEHCRGKFLWMEALAPCFDFVEIIYIS